MHAHHQSAISPGCILPLLVPPPTPTCADPWTCRATSDASWLRPLCHRSLAMATAAAPVPLLRRLLLRYSQRLADSLPWSGQHSELMRRVCLGLGVLCVCMCACA